MHVTCRWVRCIHFIFIRHPNIQKKVKIIKMALVKYQSH